MSEVGLGVFFVKKSGLAMEKVLAFTSWTLKPADGGPPWNAVSSLWYLICVFKTTKPSAQLIRWALHLQGFTFTVKYWKG